VGARYVAAAHAREATAAGVSEAVVAAIEAGRPPELIDPRQRAVAEMMFALLGPEPPSSAIFAAAVAALGHVGVAEAIALAGYFTAVGLAMKMYAVPPPQR
jgi:4-carboxymuconolactone decarboxylase